MHSMNNTRATTLTLVVQMDAERASALCQNSASADALDQEGRFFLRGAEGFADAQDPAWKGGTLMWCENALEAIVLCDYEAACGHRSQRLWDEASDANNPGHVVLSARPFWGNGIG